MLPSLSSSPAKKDDSRFRPEILKKRELLNSITQNFVQATWALKQVNGQPVACLVGSKDQIEPIRDYLRDILPKKAIKAGHPEGKPNDPWQIRISFLDELILLGIPAFTNEGPPQLEQSPESKNEDEVHIFQAPLPKFLIMRDQKDGVIKQVPLLEALKILGLPYWRSTIVVKKSDLDKRRTSDKIPVNGQVIDDKELQTALETSAEVQKQVYFDVMKDEKLGQNWGWCQKTLADFPDKTILDVICGDYVIRKKSDDPDTTEKTETKNVSSPENKDHRFYVSEEKWLLKFSIDPYGKSRYFQYVPSLEISYPTPESREDQITFENIKFDRSIKKQEVAYCSSYRVRRDYQGWPLEQITGYGIKKGQVVFVGYGTRWWVSRETMFGMCKWDGTILDPTKYCSNKKMLVLEVNEQKHERGIWLDIEAVRASGNNIFKFSKNDTTHVLCTLTTLEQSFAASPKTSLKAEAKPDYNFFPDYQILKFPQKLQTSTKGHTVLNENHQRHTMNVLRVLKEKTGQIWFLHPEHKTFYLILPAQKTLSLKFENPIIDKIYDKLKTAQIACNKGLNGEMSPLVIITEVASEELFKKLADIYDFGVLGMNVEGMEVPLQKSTYNAGQFTRSN